MADPATDKAAIIRRCYLFSGADEASVARLAERSVIEHLPARRDLFTTGDEADGLRILLSGLARIWINDAEGRELTLTLVEPGDAFGEIALLDGESRSANATLLEPSSLLFLRGAAFEAILAESPALSRHIIGLLCERLRRVTGDLSGFAFDDVATRLCRKLHELALDHSRIEGRHARFTRKFSQTDFAHMLGVTREAVNKRLAALGIDGIVRIENGWIEIPDLDRLRRIVDEASGFAR